MRRATTITVLALLMHSAQVLPQQAATAAVEGVVVQATTGEPVAGAQVTLGVVGNGTGNGILLNLGIIVTEFSPLAPAAPPPRPAAIPAVTTDSDGKFSFKQLVPGTYRITAAANGYVRQEYGQRAPSGQGRTIYLVAGESFKDASIRLIAVGTLSGRVFDENGQSATGAPVQLLRVQYNPQGKSYQSVGAANADDRGQYRIYGVAPGRYILSAGNPPGPIRAAALAGGGFTIGPAPQGAARYELLYYPNTQDLEQAAPIEIKNGSEVTMDMRLTQAKTYSVRGRVIDRATGAPPPRVQVAMGYRYLGGKGTFSQGQSYDPTTGAFELRGIAPGEYTVQAQVQEIRPVPFAKSPVRVVDSDVEGIVLALTPGVTVEGKIRLEGGQISSVGDLARLPMCFNSMTYLSDPFCTPPNPDGTFEIQGMREGEFRFTVPVTLAGYYAKSITYGGEDIYTKPLQFSGSSSGTVEVVLRAGGAQVSGTVTNAQSRPVSGIQVALIPGVNLRPDIRVTITDQNGRYSIANVPPGDYRVFSWESMDSGSYYDPDFVKQYEQQGKLVHLADSSNQNVDVKIIPAQ